MTKKLTRRQWNRWHELDRRRRLGTFRNELERQEYEDLMRKVRAADAFWRHVRPDP
jgi:hypothetical protein